MESIGTYVFLFMASLALILISVAVFKGLRSQVEDDGEDDDQDQENQKDQGPRPSRSTNKKRRKKQKKAEVKKEKERPQAPETSYYKQYDSTKKDIKTEEEHQPDEQQDVDDQQLYVAEPDDEAGKIIKSKKNIPEQKLELYNLLRIKSIKWIEDQETRSKSMDRATTGKIRNLFVNTNSEIFDKIRVSKKNKETWRVSFPMGGRMKQYIVRL